MVLGHRQRCLWLNHRMTMTSQKPTSYIMHYWRHHLLFTNDSATLFIMSFAPTVVSCCSSLWLPSSCKKPGITNKLNYELLLFLANAPLIKQLNVRYNASTDVVTAYCASQGHPIPAFSWQLDGVSVSSLDDDNADFESTLRVERIRSSRLVYFLISYHPPPIPHLSLQLEILLNQCMYPRAIFDEKEPLH